MREPQTAPTASDIMGTAENHHSSEGHQPFCQQLPDFVMALLLQDADATGRYAPLVYHLVGYDALRAALATDPRSLLAEQESLPS